MLVSKANRTVCNILFIDLAPRASGKSPAVWSLVVAKLDNSNRRLGIALKMTGLGDNECHQLTGSTD